MRSGNQRPTASSFHFSLDLFLQPATNSSTNLTTHPASYLFKHFIRNMTQYASIKPYDNSLQVSKTLFSVAALRNISDLTLKICSQISTQ